MSVAAALDLLETFHAGPSAHPYPAYPEALADTAQ
jgi:hypothetical protein